MKKGHALQTSACIMAAALLAGCAAPKVDRNAAWGRGAPVAGIQGMELTTPWGEKAEAWEGALVLEAEADVVSIRRQDGAVQTWRGIAPDRNVRRGWVLRPGTRIGTAGKHAEVQMARGAEEPVLTQRAEPFKPVPVVRWTGADEALFSSPGGFLSGGERVCQGNWKETGRTKVRRAFYDGEALDVRTWTDVSVRCVPPGSVPPPAQAEAPAPQKEPVMAEPEAPLPEAKASAPEVGASKAKAPEAKAPADGARTPAAAAEPSVHEPANIDFSALKPSGAANAAAPGAK